MLYAVLAMSENLPGDHGRAAGREVILMKVTTDIKAGFGGVGGAVSEL